MKLEEDVRNLAAQISGKLFAAELKNEVVNPAAVDNHQQLPLLRLSKVIAICMTRSGSPVEAIRQRMDLANAEVAVVLLPDSADDPGIERSYTLDLRDGRLEKIDGFVRWADQRIRELVAARQARARTASATTPT